MNQDILSVSQYLDRVNRTLKGEKAKIAGEVSGVQMYEGRSYLYFSIKDEKDQSTIKCFMWKRDYHVSGVELRDGLKVIVSAYPQVYKPNGSLSLQVETVELVGEGALQIAYEKLKKKLETEGLFSAERKRPLPEYPHRIGVITSRSGAVIHDFLSNLGTFGLEILFVDSKVEGQDAITDLLSAVHTLRDKDIDVLVIMRGGGSLESFLAFNNETLVRAVVDFPVPVVTGIGHDKDAPLVSLISDSNVSTPTAVAHLLTAHWSTARSSVLLSEQKIYSRFESSMRDCQFFIGNSQTIMEKKFASFLEIFSRAKITLDRSISLIESAVIRTADRIGTYERDMIREFEDIVRVMSDRLKEFERVISYGNPSRQLSRGYSIVRGRRGVVRRTADVAKGEELDILVSDGIINTRVL